MDRFTHRSAYDAGYWWVGLTYALRLSTRQKSNCLFICGFADSMKLLALLKSAILCLIMKRFLIVEHMSIWKRTLEAPEIKAHTIGVLLTVETVKMDGDHVKIRT